MTSADVRKRPCKGDMVCRLAQFLIPHNGLFADLQAFRCTIW
jgi:hypothetical protein